MQANYIFDNYSFLKELGLEKENMGCYRAGEWVSTDGADQVAINPHNNKPIAMTKLAGLSDYDSAVKAMKSEQAKWATTPGPVRGEVVR